MFSVAYHDIIYNTLKNNNEEKSAQFAEERLTRLSIQSNRVQNCYNQILATKGHFLSESSDTNYFTDADLAILGAAPETYQQYVSAIRKEYSFYPDFIYKKGRQKLLQHFIRMSFIYKTDHFRNKYEIQAKKNIQDELNRLDSK